MVWKFTWHSPLPRYGELDVDVLIVEDEWLIAEDNADAVRSAGHSVVGPVPSVKAALDLLDRTAVHAALLDVQLQGETTYPIADILTEKSIPFAFVTGHGSKDLPSRFSNVPLLQKPVGRPQIVRLLGNMAPADPRT